MRPSVIACLMFGSAGIIISAAAQQPERPTFRAGTTLVEFTIAAIDEHGKAVTDLRSDEIAVFEDDYERRVAFFQYEGNAAHQRADNSPLPALASGILTNRPEYSPGAPRNLVTIVLDLLHTSLEGRVELRSQFLNYLKHLPSDVQVGLYVVGERAVVVHDFTRDAESLHSRLEKGQIDIGGPALASVADTVARAAGARNEQRVSLGALIESETRAVKDFNVHLLRERRQKTLAALDSVASHLAGVPGRKSVVWISHGFPLLSDAEASYVDEVRGMAQRLATHDVAIYPVDAAGVPIYRDTPNVRGRVEGTSEMMATITGGRVTRNTNDLTRGLTEAAADVKASYSVGFYTDDNQDNAWHRLAVKVSRPGVILRHRQGYLSGSGPNSQPAWSEGNWNYLAHQPLTSTAIRIDVRPRVASGYLKLELQLATGDLQFRTKEGDVAAEIEIALVERALQGPTNIRVQAASVETPPGLRPATVSLAPEFKLHPTTTNVRVIVRDRRTGLLGSLDLPPIAKSTGK